VECREGEAVVGRHFYQSQASYDISALRSQSKATETDGRLIIIG